MPQRRTVIAGVVQEDDWTVFPEEGDEHLGRIMRVRHGPQEGLWYWSRLVGTAATGFEESHEAAAAALKRSLAD